MPIVKNVESRYNDALLYLLSDIRVAGSVQLIAETVRWEETRHVYSDNLSQKDHSKVTSDTIQLVLGASNRSVNALDTLTRSTWFIEIKLRPQSRNSTWQMTLLRHRRLARVAP